MELLITEGKNPGLGDTIFYVNNGEKKSHGDVQKKKDELVLNCYLIDERDIEMNPDLLGEYNVPRYLAAFNKRIEPLLVVFKQEVRDSLIVTDPVDRGIYTTVQCELLNGHPFEQGDQDTLEEVLTLSEGELSYWEKRGLDSNYMYELAESDWKEKLEVK
jgi:hypothetical protein